MIPSRITSYLIQIFKLKIYEKNSIEFQNFFSDLMQLVFSDFQKVRPYGKLGDEGNDGYRPESGIYYQVYSPIKPSEKSTAAVKKMESDFLLLMESEWDHIAKIKEYVFVFNDKYLGTDRIIESKIAELNRKYSKIHFSLLLPIHMETYLLEVPHEKLGILGFDIQSNQLGEIIIHQLDELEIKLNQGYAIEVYQTLTTIKPIVLEYNHKKIFNEFDLLNARVLYKLEKFDEAIPEFERICIKYSNDVRPYLYLAEISIKLGKLDENLNLLEKAEKIDEKYWLCRLERMIRNNQMNLDLSEAELNPDNFPEMDSIKSTFYRVISNYLARKGELNKAYEYSKSAILLNEERIENHLIHLEIKKEKYRNDHSESYESLAESLLDEIETYPEKFTNFKDFAPRIHLTFNWLRFILRIECNKYHSAYSIIDIFLQSMKKCYFDKAIDNKLYLLLNLVSLDTNYFQIIVNYLDLYPYKLSSLLKEKMFIAFLRNNKLFNEGYLFFERHNDVFLINLIDDLKNQNYDSLLEKAGNNVLFLADLFLNVKSVYFRERILSKIPEDSPVNTNILRILLEEESGNSEAAFAVMRLLDLSSFGFFEYQKFLNISIKNKAWENVIALCDKLLCFEIDDNFRLNIYLNKFNALQNLRFYQKIIYWGNEIIGNQGLLKILKHGDFESIVNLILISCLKVDSIEENEKALSIVDANYSKVYSFEFYGLIASKVYLRNNLPPKVIKSIIDGITTLKNPRDEEFASLFMVFQELKKVSPYLSIDSLPTVTENTFIKIKDEKRWLYFGDEEVLGATEIKTEWKEFFIDQSPGSEISFNSGIGKPVSLIIESIHHPINYVMVRSFEAIRNLSLDAFNEQLWTFNLEQDTNGNLDFSELSNFLRANYEKVSEIYRLFEKNPHVPIAFLATLEGSLSTALARINHEGIGYVRMSDGSFEEFQEQVKVASDILDKNESFVIDGTSALVWSELDLFSKLKSDISNLNVPNSVLNFLYELQETLKDRSSSSGNIYYSNGKLIFNEHEPGYFSRAIEKIENAIQSIPVDSILIISDASRKDIYTEKEALPYLCDAVILAKSKGLYLLTEDINFVLMNEEETKENRPKYFSSFALIKVLHERNLIGDSLYLEVFYYVANSRFFFIPISVKDLELIVASVPVDQLKKTIISYNLKHLLSKDYGTDSKAAIKIVVEFLLTKLFDFNIEQEMFVRIYIDFLSSCVDLELFNEITNSFKAILLYVGQNDLMHGHEIAQERFNRLEEILNEQL